MALFKEIKTGNIFTDCLDNYGSDPDYVLLPPRSAEPTEVRPNLMKNEDAVPQEELPQEVMRLQGAAFVADAVLDPVAGVRKHYTGLVVGIDSARGGQVKTIEDEGRNQVREKQYPLQLFTGGGTETFKISVYPEPAPGVIVRNTDFRAFDSNAEIYKRAAVMQSNR